MHLLRRQMPHLIFFLAREVQIFGLLGPLQLVYFCALFSVSARTGEYQKQGEAVGEGTYGTVWKVGADSLKLRHHHTQCGKSISFWWFVEASL